MLETSSKTGRLSLRNTSFVEVKLTILSNEVVTIRTNVICETSQRQDNEFRSSWITVQGKVVQVAPPHGTTLVFSAATHVLAKQFQANPPYDPQTDFAPVTQGGVAAEGVRAQPAKRTAALPVLGAPSHLGRAKTILL